MFPSSTAAISGGCATLICSTEDRTINRVFLVGLAIAILSACAPSRPGVSTPKLEEGEIRSVLETEFPGRFHAGSDISGPLTIEEIEAKELAEVASCATCPQVPFGYMNDEWEEFKARVQDNDVIVHFYTDAESWRALAGREGYALIRGRTVVTTIITTLN